LCAFILFAMGARSGVWQMMRQQVTAAKRATNEWERTAFLLKDAESRYHLDCHKITGANLTI